MSPRRALSLALARSVHRADRMQLQHRARLLSALLLTSVSAVSGLCRAEESNAAGSHPVAPEPHGSELTAPGAGGHASTAPETVQATASSTAPDVTPQTREHWYGWQTLVIDVTSLAVLITGAAATSPSNEWGDTLVVAGLGGYLLGAPITHVVHDSPGRGLGSLALRAGIPFLGGVVGLSASEGCTSGDDNVGCRIGAAALGGVLGMVAAAAIDATLLGHERVPLDSTGVQSVGVSLGRGHAALVAGGSF